MFQMRCKYCGKPLDDDAAFCKYCGEHNPAPRRRPSNGSGRSTASERPASSTGRRPAAGAQGSSRRPTGSAKHPNTTTTTTRRRQAPPPEPEKVSVLDQMPKWVIPTAVAAAAVLIVTGVIMVFNTHKGDVNKIEVPPETDVVMTDPPTETVEETETETETEVYTEPTDAPFDSDSTWAQSYYSAILDFEKANKEVSPKAMKYRLLYINDDEIPELYMQAGDNSSLYTIVNDEAKPILEAKRQSDERLQGIRTRRGLFLTYSKDGETETYTVNRLRTGEVTPLETYISEDSSYTINGSSVDLVEFTQQVRAKQANYQFNGVQLLNKADMLEALKKSVDSDDIPEKAPDEEDVVIETIDPDSASDDDEQISRTGTARFEVYSGMLTWSEAQAKCKAKGGHLAYIKSKADYDAVMAAIKKADSGLIYLWVGGKTTITDSGVKASWTDGSSTRYLDDEKLWFGHEPSGKDGDIREPYMMLWNPNGERWSFNDNSDSCVKIYSSGTMGYVCEFDE